MNEFEIALAKKAEIIGIDEETLKETLVLFFEALAEQLVALRAYVKAEDFANLHILSHTIKGTSLNLYFKDIAKSAGEIEKNAVKQTADKLTYLSLINKLDLQASQAKMKICYK